MTNQSESNLNLSLKRLEDEVRVLQEKMAWVLQALKENGIKPMPINSLANQDWSTK